jgi:hypothetical protein
LLGLDIPPTPLIDLADIRADGAIIHWSLPDQQKHKTSLKFEIHLNGTVIQTISVQESAVTITGLLPGSSYIVRVGLVNSSDFGSKSAPIRFQTKPPTSGDYFISATSEPGDGDQDAASQPIPRALPYRGLKNIAIASPEEQTSARELGANARRSTIGARRVSPALNVIERQDKAAAEDEEGETIQQLTERLDEIRREIEDAERCANDDEEDEVRQKEELLEERDRLKAEVMERDKASKGLRKELSILERQNTTAQNERIKQDKILQQKKQERQKLVDDAIQWERDAQEMQQDVERLRREKQDYIAKAKEQRESLVKKQATELASIKALEEQLKAKTLEVKKLEREVKEASPQGADAELYLAQQQQQDAEDRRQWDLHYGALQHEYAVAAQKEQQAKHIHEEQVRILQGLRARRRQEDLAQYSSPPASLPRRTDSQRSRRGQSGQNGQSATESPRTTLYQTTSSSFGPSLTSTASAFGPSGSMMHIGNGMGSGLASSEVLISEADRQRLTGGAMLSPGAGAELLPADLFMDGDSRGSYVQPLPGLGAIPNAIPGLGEIPAQTTPDQANAGPVSPISETGRSQSVFASPQASQQNLHLGSPENIIDADRRSIRSTRSNRATSGCATGSRFSGMFGIMSRSKAVSAEEGLALGKVQSHSMPRHDQGLPGLDLSSRKRNSSISASVMSGGSSSLANEAFDAQSDDALPRSRRPFAFFHKEKGWPSSFGHPRNEPTTRPVSTHSIDLPRPSLDGGNRWMVDPWPSNDASGSGNRSSPLAFGTTSWNPPASQQSRVYGSRLPSRRPSAQYGVHGPPPVGIPEADDFSDVSDADPEAYLAPIGTRPTPSPRKPSNPDEPASSPAASAAQTAAASAAAVDPTKLNPAAKDFKSFFSSIKLRDKDKDKSKEPSSSSSVVGTPALDGIDTDDSPPASRKSRETRDGAHLSLTTTLESNALESGRQSPILFALTPSQTNTSEAIAPSPLLSPSVGGSSLGKETFMQKLSRKSSSGKFALPTFKRSGGGEKSSSSNNVLLTPTTPTVPSVGGATDDDTDDAMSASVGSLRERDSREFGASTSSQQQQQQRHSGRGWGHVLKLGSGGGGGSAAGSSIGAGERMGRRKGGQTPSLSSMSLRSGGTGTTEEGGNGTVDEE